MHRVFLPFACLALIASPALAQQTPAPQPARVSVTGEGEATVRPDMATISLAVLREAETAREALDANNAAMAAVIAAMKAEGIAETDLQTSGFSVQPRYVFPNESNGNQEAKIVAYQVVNTLGVRVNDLEKVGTLLDRAVTLGVNQGGEITFSSKDPSAAMTEARKRAVEDAMVRARTLTEAAGVSLGRILDLSEVNSTPRPVPMMARSFSAQAAEAVPVQPGENSYNVKVNMSFEIEQ